MSLSDFTPGTGNRLMKVRLFSVPNTNHHFLQILIEILYSIFDFKVLLASISLPKVYIWTKGIQNWDWESKWKRGATSYICHNSLKLKFKVPSNAFCSPSKMIFVYRCTAWIPISLLFKFPLELALMHKENILSQNLPHICTASA